MTADPNEELPPGVTAEDAPTLDAFAVEGIGEGDFGESHEVPADLIELGEVLEWQAATEAARDA